MSKPVVHFEIAGRDAENQQRFYSELFGWSVQRDDPPGYALVRSGEGGIDGGLTCVEEGAAPYVTVYVEVDDVAAHLARATELGGAVVLEQTALGDLTIGMFRDPDGNVIGLVKPAE